MSSNIKNTGFYNSLGFVTKAQVSVGDEDPDWTEPPVVVSLVCYFTAANTAHIFNDYTDD